jgi:hypothetical protein
MRRMTGRRDRAAHIVVGLAALVLFATSATVAVARSIRGEAVTGEERLAEARGFVVEHQSARTTGDTRTEADFGSLMADEDIPPDQATTIVSRALVDGVFDGAERTRMRSRSNGAEMETIVIEETAWTRFAPPDEELSDAKWIEVDVRTGGFEGGPGGGWLDDPSGAMISVSSDLQELGSLVALIDRSVAPTIVSSEDAETVIRSGIAPFGGEANDPVGLERGTVELTLADDGRPVRSVVEVTLRVAEEEEIPGLSARVQTRMAQEYSGWGEAVEIEPPAAADIDRTPSIDEEGVAAYQDATLYQPSGIPEGWVLEYAEVYPADDSGCDEVELGYTDPEDEYNGYLSLYEKPADCADVDPPTDSEPFTAGPNRGWIEIVEDGFVYAQLVVGRTVIDIETDLPPASLERILSQLQTVDLTVEPRSIPGLGTAGRPS